MFLAPAPALRATDGAGAARRFALRPLARSFAGSWTR